MFLSIVAAVTLLASRALAAPATTAAGCDRAALLAAADAYVKSQEAGRLDALTTLAGSGWKYVENNVEMSATKSVLTKALKIENRRTNVDMVDCATYTELIAPSGPFVIGTQIHHDKDTMAVALVDTIASTTNSWIFDAAKTLSYVVKEDWFTIPEDKRDRRDAIKAAGDAYMDLWSDATAENRVPWGTPCTRLEGSAYTGRGLPTDSCKAGIPSNHNQKPNSNRRYVIDEAMGSVSIFCVWEHMMNAADAHEFRLEGGKLRYVHTMTVCGGQVCRL
jgi:hypothetical protein